MNTVQVSVILATRNRESILWPTVEKAVASIEGKAAELIIVNDGDEELHPKAELTGKIRTFKSPKRGVSSARNYGAANAAGPILFFIDDDMWILPEVIDWIINRMNDEKNAHEVYNINWEYPPALFQKLKHSKVGRYLLDANYYSMWGRMHQKGAQPSAGLYPYHSIASCSLVMHKNVFQKLNGYNEKMIFQGEDIDLSNRLREMTVPVYAVFDITLFHNHQDRLEIGGFLDRASSGYSSEFKSAKAGLIKPLGNREYKGSARFIFELFLFTEKAWIFFYKILPNHAGFKPVSNKLVGLLSGLTRFKEWKKVSKGIEQ
jgi:glycosyltransferase involved in cell wall biosynthesis